MINGQKFKLKPHLGGQICVAFEFTVDNSWALKKASNGELKVIVPEWKDLPNYLENIDSNGVTHTFYPGNIIVRTVDGRYAAIPKLDFFRDFDLVKE